MTLGVPEQDACPATAAADALLPAYDESYVAYPIPPVSRRVAARSACFYRVAEVRGVGCDVTRDKALGLARSDEPQPPFAWDGSFSSCDADGPLLGLVVEATEACPDPIDLADPYSRDETPMDPYGREITELVGRDDYPARRSCTYETRYETTCGGLSGGLFGLG